jgi:hypothetical protein
LQPYKSNLEILKKIAKQPQKPRKNLLKLEVDIKQSLQTKISVIKKYKNYKSIVNMVNKSKL